MNKHEEEGREFSEEELEELFKAADEEGDPPPPFFASPRFRKIVVSIIAVMLFAQVLAFFPKIYSLPAIRFLTVSAKLSQLETIQTYKESVVVVRTDDAKGTGFLISEDGLVVTNRHVVGEENAPRVHLPDGESYIAEVIAIHDEVDLALLDIEVEGAPVLKLAESYDGQEGLPIYVIGNPLFFNGIANEGETWGLLSDRRPPMLVLQAPVYKGNSGSPVITHEGEVIGVVYATSEIQRNGYKHKVGLAVPVSWVWNLAQEVGTQKATP